MKYTDEFDKKRLETFVDAILAIILTILVLEFSVPAIENATTASLIDSLSKMLPAICSYVISFFTVISLWIDHHYLLKAMKKADRNFAILNMVFLLTLSPLPFTTEFAGTYIHVPLAVAIMSANYILMNFGFALLWGYAAKKNYLIEGYFSDPVMKRQSRISMIGFIILVITIPLAFINPYAPFACFILVILMHLLK